KLGRRPESQHGNAAFLRPGQIRGPKVRSEAFAYPKLVEAFIAAEVMGFKLLDRIFVERAGKVSCDQLLALDWFFLAHHGFHPLSAYGRHSVSSRMLA